jgi:SAM-dependent methyltransferase
MKDIAIIDAFPIYDCPKKVFTVGCGAGRIEKYINDLGYDVLATDYVEQELLWTETNTLKFKKFNIGNDTVEQTYPIAICSQVLEHIKEYKKAFSNLIDLAEIRLIITVPFGKSFNDPGHINFWYNTNEFYEMVKPYVVSVSKIRTKPRDRELKQWAYLIIVDKRQCYE